ncbi:hypothetical protein Trydic_g20961 [Trypoxylus dichotomus]
MLFNRAVTHAYSVKGGKKFSRRAMHLEVQQDIVNSRLDDEPLDNKKSNSRRTKTRKSRRIRRNTMHDDTASPSGILCMERDSDVFMEQQIPRRARFVTTLLSLAPRRSQATPPISFGY